MAGVRRTAPRRREEHGVRPQVWCKPEEVGADKVDGTSAAVHHGVGLGEPQPLLGGVNRHDVPTGSGEGDGVAPRTRERVHGHAAGAAARLMIRDRLRRDRVPRLLVHADAVVEAAEQAEPLVPVLLHHHEARVPGVRRGVAVGLAFQPFNPPRGSERGRSRRAPHPGGVASALRAGGGSVVRAAAEAGVLPRGSRRPPRRDEPEALPPQQRPVGGDGRKVGARARGGHARPGRRPSLGLRRAIRDPVGPALGGEGIGTPDGSRA
mmetsp:Transcript_30151/g.71805  ORF Transcript_30151/g.71805 Transcript_30151/m.71805 type:complete len:265 (-) Transcript_30151:730-1524(-)